MTPTPKPKPVAQANSSSWGAAVRPDPSGGSSGGGGGSAAAGHSHGGGTSRSEGDDVGDGRASGHADGVPGNGLGREETRRKKARQPPGCLWKFAHTRQCRVLTGVLVCAIPLFGLLTLPELLQTYSKPVQVFHWAVSLYFIVSLLFHFVATCSLEAGFVEPSMAQGGDKWRLVVEAGAAESLKGEDELSDGQLARVNEVLFASRWCSSCQLYKPPRAHHCSTCKRCVKVMSHHCPFTGNCIGLVTRPHFIQMYLTAVLGLLYCLALCVAHVAQEMSLAKFTSLYFSPKGPGGLGVVGGGFISAFVMLNTTLLVSVGPYVSCLVSFSLIAMFAVLILGTGQVYLALRGISYLEYSLPSAEFVELQTDVFAGCSFDFFQLSLLGNLRALWGRSWLRRLLVPGLAAPQACCLSSHDPGGDGHLQEHRQMLVGSRALKLLKKRLTELDSGVPVRQVDCLAQLGIGSSPDEA